MEYLSWFLFSFIFIYVIYNLLFLRRTVRGEKVPSEVQCLIYLFKLDVNLFSYRKFAKTVGLITTIDISIVALIIAKVEGVVWQILFGFVAVVPICVLSFVLLGKYYQKKQTMDNSVELAKEKIYLDKLEKKKKQNKKDNNKKKNNKKVNKKGKK